MDEFKEIQRPAGRVEPEEDALLKAIRKIVQESAEDTAKRLLDRVEALVKAINTHDTKGE